MAELQFIHIEDADDPRLEDYRDIRDRDLMGEAGRPGLFIGEQTLTVEKMLSIPGLTKSVLITPNWRERFQKEFTGPGAADSAIPVYIIPEEMMRDVAGFRIHRGVLAVGFRPRREALIIDAVVGGAALRAASRGRDTLTLLLLEDIANIDNMGMLFRNAAAFGVDAVVLSPRCHDPLYRKSIRVSIGHVLSIPWARSENWHDDLRRLREEWQITLIAAATGAAAQPLDSIDPPPRVGIVVGPEYEGLSPSTLKVCDHIARIPMAAGVDSLNVAVASAVCLHRFSRRERT